jgi:hypothetical protein
MLTLDITKKKELNFEVKVDGINNTDLSGSIRLEIDGVEYGFPVNVTTESINVVIPPLKNIVHRVIKEGEKFKVKLEMNGDGYYLNPWNDEVNIKNSVMVEAKLVESSKPTIQLKENDLTKGSSKLEAKKVEKVPVKIKQEPVIIEEKHIIQYMASQGVKDKRIQDTIYEQCMGVAGTDDKKKILKEIIKFFKSAKTPEEL